MSQDVKISNPEDDRRRKYRTGLFARIFRGFTVNLAVDYLIRHIDDNENLSVDEQDKCIAAIELLLNLLLPDVE
jgi:hypothetical protein